jgi:exopolysaccharide biosynthesis polyprenyl glycosylphosphotransferase
MQINVAETHASLADAPVQGSQQPRPRTFGRKMASVLAELTSGAWMCIDFSLAIGCMLMANWMGTLAHLPVVSNTMPAGPSGLLFGGVFFIFAHLLGLHERNLHRGELGLIIKSSVAVGITVLVCRVAIPLVFEQGLSGKILSLGALALLSCLILTRAWIWRVGFMHPERLCLIGDAEELAKAKEFLLQQPRPVDLTLIPSENVVDVGDNFVRWAKDRFLDEIVCLQEVPAPLGVTMLNCMENGVRVTNYADHLERHYRCVTLDRLDHRWFLRTDMEALHPQYIALKRLSDILLASAGLLAASPFLLLAMLAVKLESPGPVFYSQVRTGLRGKPFSIFKLRSMRTDAEKQGAQWAKKNDARVTRIGKLLRLSRLDEIPQFLNILRGEMSFIGPRPERPEFVETLAAEIPFYKQRHLMKPGLTGWAQIQADYGGTVEGVKVKLQYDLYYVKYASLALDFHICLRTIGAMMKGAR